MRRVEAPMAAAADGEGRAGARRSRARSALIVFSALCGGLAVTGCDDLVKMVPIFSTMGEQPSVETYENQPREPVAGTIPVDGERLYQVAEDGRLEGTLTLQEADTLSPPTATRPDLNLGQQRFIEFCTPCHGPRGQGNGSVVGPNRIPEVPMLDLTSAQARGYSDGYIFGMITVGRGLMPSYRRIPAAERWDVVAYVRALQSGGPAGTGTTPGGASPAGATPGAAPGADTTPAGGDAADGKATGEAASTGGGR